jgi:hypothetical protein
MNSSLPRAQGLDPRSQTCFHAGNSASVLVGLLALGGCGEVGVGAENAPIALKAFPVAMSFLETKPHCEGCNLRDSLWPACFTHQHRSPYM